MKRWRKLSRKTKNVEQSVAHGKSLVRGLLWHFSIQCLWDGGEVQTIFNLIHFKGYIVHKLKHQLARQTHTSEPNSQIQTVLFTNKDKSIVYIWVLLSENIYVRGLCDPFLVNAPVLHMNALLWIASSNGKVFCLSSSSSSTVVKFCFRRRSPWLCRLHFPFSSRKSRR